MEATQSVTGQECTGPKPQTYTNLLNNRYHKVKRLGEGAYGTVYLAIDTKPTGIKRQADPKALLMLDKIAEVGVSADGDVQMKDSTGSYEAAKEVLANRSLIFQQNDAF
jgi:serine/threonine protein kinase